MPNKFVRTDTVLDRILDRKVEEVAESKALCAQEEHAALVRDVLPARDMVTALRRETVTLIAEVKHASPSRGVLIDSFDPVKIALEYASNGAAAISVLTDRDFFQGSLDDLVAVRQTVKIPVLRKDFIIDPYQVYEARVAGADAVLLIVAALADAQIADLHGLVVELGMTALVEVHDDGELERALRLAPSLVGVNNRDLRTFDVDLATAERLAAQVPANVTLVAESGIFTPEDVRRMGRAGARAVLVGESLVTAADRGAMVQSLSHQPCEVRS